MKNRGNQTTVRFNACVSFGFCQGHVGIKGLVSFSALKHEAITPVSLLKAHGVFAFAFVFSDLFGFLAGVLHIVFSPFYPVG